MKKIKRYNAIHLRGVRQNNLKGFDLDLPIGKLVVVTGLSGSGKSSLVFETLHAEGQRRYAETFSPYTRQFLEMLDRPRVDNITNIRPSIAIQQSNTVKTSRSTVGTMTELCDFFKVWFCQVSDLYDPDTGKIIEDDNPQSIWKKVLVSATKKTVILSFMVKRPGSLTWSEIFKSLSGQGYTRVITQKGIKKIADTKPSDIKNDTFYVIQDRLEISKKNKARFIEAAQTAMHFGKGEIHLFTHQAAPLAQYAEGLRSPSTGKIFKKPVPALFSFNSPIGACPRCRGFGRIIEIDYRLVIPDSALSIEEGAIRAFQGPVYGGSQRDLLHACKKHSIRTNVPFRKLGKKEQSFIIQGDPGYGMKGRKPSHPWYGVKRFFSWLENNTYKMHVRVFLSKYRAYTTCPECRSTRLKPEALNWKWRGHTLPDLYHLPVSDLLTLLSKYHQPLNDHQGDIAAESILNRLSYLEQVGLGYLTLNRTSRTLSGGEVERVNLTSCLGTSLVDTLFVLDEPSIGLHAQDIERLIGILKRLTRQGNTVVVVEHDESIIRAADHVIEVGPNPGTHGGYLTFSGNSAAIEKKNTTLTGSYLIGEKTINAPDHRRPINFNANGNQRAHRHKFNKEPQTALAPHPHLTFKGASRYNIKALDFQLPLQRMVCLSGVSGSGKSTLLDNVIYQGLLVKKGKAVESPARINRIDHSDCISHVVLVDQSPVSRTPRSNSALYTDSWELIRTLYASTEAALSAGLTASSFSFNSGYGRCEHCKGLGYERVEMQFMADVFVTCPLCEGRRFKPSVLEINWGGKSIADILDLTVSEAADFFGNQPFIIRRLQTLIDIGLGYLPLGQPLNTLSGGESQRLKLVKYLSNFGDRTEDVLILLDEPTTGLHRDDVKRLITVLQKLVSLGHSLVVIEHHLDLLKSADWIMEMGPGPGSEGGGIVFTGTPEELAKKHIASSPYIAESLQPGRNGRERDINKKSPERYNFKSNLLLAAEPASPYKTERKVKNAIEVVGAREHNLKNISLSIPHREITVITGVSGSGKSSLAFDIIFAEGQRRFMESMSPYARQFVEQLPRPDIDRLAGIPPTVAIEQRVTRGTRKSTVATITEVAQYLRLLYSRVGQQYNPRSGEPVVALSPTALKKRFDETLHEQNKKRQPLLYLCAPLVRSRKGHHQPLANWAADHGFNLLRIDGQFVRVSDFQKLDRYRDHDIEVVVSEILLKGKKIMPDANGGRANNRDYKLNDALILGKGTCFIATVTSEIIAWFSTMRSDPITGESFPELDPKHFSWNSPKGWCPACRGHGRIYAWMADDDDYPDDVEKVDSGALCPSCHGDRLNVISRSVRLHFKDGLTLSLPRILKLTPSDLMDRLHHLKLDHRSRTIARDLLPEIEERLKFMKNVGLEYLTLDRATNTLSGGEAQRIRLAAQLGSNLSGVLYVLDEPTIGLHARDNVRLMKTLQRLRSRGNTLLIVEHDEETMRYADRIIDLGPGAGVHGGGLLANSKLSGIIKNKKSLTGAYLTNGIKHPRRGRYRPLPSPWNARSKRKHSDWLVAKKVSLRNLKGDDLFVPQARLTVVCGISGAGKSTLVRDLLIPAVNYASQNKIKNLNGKSFIKNAVFEMADQTTYPFSKLINGHGFRHVIEVDQSPIGKTPRSTPATYIGAFDVIRQFFASLPESKIQGYSAGTFSFNTRGGRCEKCRGAGRIKLEMNFLPDTYIDCDACGGHRFGLELEEIRWKGKNISEVLKMTFEEAAQFFAFHSKLKAMLELMVEMGLSYLKLGQSSPTLSGGEAQRLKLVSELAKGLQSYREKSRGIIPRNLYLLEEPTIGLHLSDCEKLIELLHRLVDQGNTVMVIEHHPDIIAEADYIIEIGPEGGEQGGEILYQGAPQGLLQCARSPSAPYLRDKIG